MNYIYIINYLFIDAFVVILDGNISIKLTLFNSNVIRIKRQDSVLLMNS